MSTTTLHIWIGVFCLVMVVHAAALIHLSNTVRDLLSHIAYQDMEREGRMSRTDRALRGGLSELAWRNESGKDKPDAA